MRGTDRIDSHALEFFELAFKRTAMYGRADAAHVMMHAHTEHLDILPVDEEPLVLVPTDAPHSETGIMDVLENISTIQLGPERIKIRAVRTPEPRSAELELAAGSAVSTGSPCRCYPSPAVVEDPVSDFQPRCLRTFDVCLHPYETPVTRDRGRHEVTVVCHMGIRSAHEPHIAVDAASGIPP